MTLSVAVGALTRVSVLVFGVPLVALLLGGWLGGLAGGSPGAEAEVISGLSGLAALALAGFAVVRRIAVTDLLKLEAAVAVRR